MWFRAMMIEWMVLLRLLLPLPFLLLDSHLPNRWQYKRLQSSGQKVLHWNETIFVGMPCQRQNNRKNRKEKQNCWTRPFFVSPRVRSFTLSILKCVVRHESFEWNVASKFSMTIHSYLCDFFKWLMIRIQCTSILLYYCMAFLV